MFKKYAIIIGGGPAGLTAAYYFLKHSDIKPIVLEKEKFVGGISRTMNFNGNRMDIGGHRFFSKDEEILSLWRELLPEQGAPALDDKVLNRESVLTEGGANPEETDEVFLNRRRVSRIFYRRKFFSYPISLSLETIFNLGFFEMISIGTSFIGAKFSQREEKTLEDFMINRFGRRLYETFFRDYTTKVWGRSPAEIGADWGSQRIKGLSLGKTILDFFKKTFGFKDGAGETSLIERFYYPKYGPGQLWEQFAAEIKKLGGEVLTESEVKSFTIGANKIIRSVEVKSPAGNLSFPADYFLSSMPLNELADAFDEKTLATRPREIAKGLPYRDFITVGLLVDKLLPVNKTKIKTFGDIVPDCWIYIQEPSVKLGRLQIFNNWSPYLVADPQNSVWLGLEYFCNEGDNLWNMNEEDFIKFATEELSSIGIINAADVKYGVRVRVPKAYPAYFDTYENIDELRNALNEIQNLYCIGRNGQHRYNNMDHSMLTAMAAVRAIVSGDVSKSDIWNVNADKNYHEGKQTE
ncbi:MAG: NAD(P)/FAD-dependent oxidoreductase [Selenomonadaceae bacterium]|nr:NAD(P)/FAD-dependent oxidoreductase [Selenomonadaceae bacterium]